MSDSPNIADEDYHDIRTVSFLKFSYDRAARRLRHFIGENAQLQCQNLNLCSYSGYPEEASCYNLSEYR